MYLSVVSDVWRGGPKNGTETKGSAWLLVDSALIICTFSSLHPLSCLVQILYPVGAQEMFRGCAGLMPFLCSPSPRAVPTT